MQIYATHGGVINEPLTASRPARPIDRRSLLGLLTLACMGLGANRAKAGASVEDLALAELHREARSPDAYVVDLFRTADVVLLGEDHAIAQTLAFVRDLIPSLYAAGVRHLVMEFGAEEDQAALDALTTAPTWDADTARRLMFNYNVAWSWLDYRALYEAAWRFNRALPQGAPPFRVLNMSYVFDWTAYRSPASPASLRGVFHRGTIDRFRADLIQREILDRNEKALVLTGTPHAFMRYASGRIERNADGFCSFDNEWLGNHLLRGNGGRIASVLMHQPFPAAAGADAPYIQPAGGAIERLMRRLGDKPAGFGLRGRAVGRLPDDSAYALCHPDFTLGDFFDGYVFLAPIARLAPATADLDFVDAAMIQTALAQFPDPDWKAPPSDLTGFRAHLAGMPEDIRRRYAAVPEATR